MATRVIGPYIRCAFVRHRPPEPDCALSEEIREQLQATLGTAYTLERELGGGGMSRVFVAEETALRRKVVVKVLPPELTAGVNVERFNREILLAAKLQHPHIVPVLSAGETQGLPYYTMPLVEGESLRARLLRAGALSITDAASVLKDVARALAYAHERGIVHRDIKPDNVLITGGSATVTDFGIAKAISASRTQASNETLTQIGTSIGTPTYMSPEQAAGDPTTDQRTDIYSFGCMAYELLAGQPPFTDKTPRKLLASHMGDKPRPLLELRADTPASLADLVMRCLAKEADDRPQHATDLVHVLETVMSSGGSTAMPAVLLGGPGMFRKALAIYAAAFVAVAILAKAAIVGIGLPDWVFPGSLIVMALGLPVVLWTGYVQRVTRRAMTMTPTFTPGGTPAMAQGTIATIALKAAPRMSWYRTARGGMYALATFIIMIAAFMGMRAFGIGPFGSLIATGDLTGRDKVIITDFAASNADTSLGRVVGEAIRAGLADSRVFTMLSPSEMAGALQRMQRSASSNVNLETARQIALREGAKAIVDGDVTLVGTSYIVVVRLVTADSARPLASFRGTASGSDAIIDVADDLSRKLRAKAGESLRRVQATPALAYATTSSLEALRKYSDATRANDVERDYAKAVRLLREAVALDSNFAEGWRKLAVAMGNGGGYPPSVLDSIIRRAVALSGRMIERERDVVLASFYNSSATGRDRAKAAAVYERMLARGDTAVGGNNLALLYLNRREYARAESLYRATIAKNPDGFLAYSGLVGTLSVQGKLREADSIVAIMGQRFPTTSNARQEAMERLLDRGRLDDFKAAIDSARKAGDRRDPTYAIRRLASSAEVSGRPREALALTLQARAIDSTRQQVAPLAFALGNDVARRVNVGLPIDAQLRAFDAAVVAMSVDAIPVTDRPYAFMAIVNARAGRLDRAKEMLGRYTAAMSDTALRRINTPGIQRTQAEVAAAEHRWTEAAELYRQSDRLPDGPAGANPAGVTLDLARMFAKAGMADSAIAQYEEYVRTPYGGRARQGPDVRVDGALTEAIAKAYDAKGDSEQAAALYRDFVALWKNAEPELQPRVAAARARLRELGQVEKPR